MIAVALLFARLALGGLFATAALAKAADRDGTRAALRGFGVTERLAGLSALLLPAAELAVAGALLPQFSARWGAVGAITLLALFVAGITAAIARGRTPDCHCFGRLHSSPAGWATLARNVALTALAGVVAWRGPGTSLASPFAGLSTPERAGILAGLLIIPLFILQAWFSLQLLRQNGRLLLRLEALEDGSSAPIEQGLPLGAPAPAFSLPDLHGATQTLDSLRGLGRPLLLVFTDPQCVPCNALLPDVARWQRAGTLTVALITSGSAEENRVRSEELALENVLLQDEREVAASYGVNGTPMAVAVDRDGRIASRVAAGREAITALFDAALPELAAEHASAANGHGPLAAAAVLSGAGAVALASAAGRAKAAAPPGDPEILQIKATVDAANARLLADLERIRSALLALVNSKARRPVRTALKRAVERQRTDVLALRDAVAALQLSGPEALKAQNLVTTSLRLDAEALQQFEAALATTHHKELQLAVKRTGRRLAGARDTGRLANIALGCTKDC